MADARHIEYRFLAISRRLIGRSTRNSERRWRITCQYRSRDQNYNFPKFKMADGSHFENSFISISLPWITDFDQICYTQMQISIPSMEIWQKIEIFQIQDGGRTPYWKSFFWLYLGAILAD